jgi:hypothetical protein
MKWNKKNLLKLKAFLLLSSKLPVPGDIRFFTSFSDTFLDFFVCIFSESYRYGIVYRSGHWDYHCTALDKNWTSFLVQNPYLKVILKKNTEIFGKNWLDVSKLWLFWVQKFDSDWISRRLAGWPQKIILTHSQNFGSKNRFRRFLKTNSIQKLTFFHAIYREGFKKRFEKP